MLLVVGVGRVWYHHQWARSPVGPGQGATAGGGWVGGRASDPGAQYSAVGVGDGQSVGGSGDGDDAAVVAAVVIRAQRRSRKFMTRPDELKRVRRECVPRIGLR
ncbi:hypothetical protein NIIDMKKI_05370 [Mycobacterium kansasii]|uniref:Uncharacterized protein n=1 Tax=Mycobacterium kansasii TaxID=1768 RepID=A0A7G1I2R1_MYCKA|nr:hypothetical protein NIIDMKKI_05370 [Mycobacterium kansasii]